MAQGGHTQTVAGSLVGKRRNLRLGAVHAGAISGMHCRCGKSCEDVRHNSSFTQRLVFAHVLTMPRITHIDV